MILNRLINFQQIGKHTWTHKQFYISGDRNTYYCFGNYKIQYTDEYCDDEYELVRILVKGDGVSYKHIDHSPMSMAFLAAKAEYDLFDLIIESTEPDSYNRYTAITIISLIKCIDEIIDVVNRNEDKMYAYVKIREKACAYLRIYFRMGFRNKNIIDGLRDRLFHNDEKALKSIMEDITNSILLLTREEVRTNGDESGILVMLTNESRKLYKLAGAHKK